MTIISLLLEGAAQPPGREALYTAGATFLLVAGQWISNHRKGKSRTSELDGTLDKKLKPIAEGLSTLSGEVRDLKAYVIGPDGENGLRGDVREMKEDIKTLQQADRERLKEEFGRYDRRGHGE